MKIFWFNCGEIIPGVSIALATIAVFWAFVFAYLDLETIPDLDETARMAQEREENLERFRSENHSVFVLGYTGETGKEVLKELSATNAFKKVVLIGRRETTVASDLGPNFEEKVINFDELDKHKEAFKGYDVGINCLGTTRGKSGVEGFVKVDHDYVLQTAEIAKEEGCKHFIHTSSQGSDKNSSFLYPRIKGQVEEALKVMHFERLSIFRPGVLMCDRQESRPGETVFRTLLKPFAYLFPTAISTPTEVVAKAMINNAISLTENKTELFENKAIHMLAGAIKPKTENVKKKPAPKSQSFATKKAEEEENKEL